MSLTERTLIRFVKETKDTNSMLKALQDMAFLAQTEIVFETEDLEAENDEEKYFYKAIYYFVRKKPDSKTGEMVNPVFGNTRSEIMKRIALHLMNSDAQKFFKKI